MARPVIITKLPEKVTLLCRKVGEVHIFTCLELRGLHFGVDELNEASYASAFSALSRHASTMCGHTVKYSESMSFAEFIANQKNSSSGLMTSDLQAA